MGEPKSDRPLPAGSAPEPGVEPTTAGTSAIEPTPEIAGTLAKAPAHVLSAELASELALVETVGVSGDLGRTESLRVHQPRRALPTDVVRPTRAEVSLSALRHNLGQLRKIAKNTQLFAVLKADAYGHGSKAVGRTLERAGVDGICVALVEEGVELREAGIALPILVMGGYYGNAFAELVHYRLTPVLSDRHQVERLGHALAHSEAWRAQRFPCHVKIDTGMSRLGVRPEEVDPLIESLRDRPELEVFGLMSHFANADLDEDEVLERPLALFQELRGQFCRAGFEPAQVHFANSAGLLRTDQAHFDMARPGIALFGVDPLATCAKSRDRLPEVQLKPTMAVRTKIVALRMLGPGETVGYGGTFVARRPTTIATVPMGYADGLSRLLSNRGQGLVRGKRASIVGNVSMDMTTIDVTDIPGVSLYDDVVFLGTQNGPLGVDTITVSQLAAWCGTIPWEILTNISRRVPRFYREA